MKYLITFLLLPLFALTQTNNPMPGKQVQLSYIAPLHTIEEYGITFQPKSLHQRDSAIQSKYQTTIQISDKKDPILLMYYETQLYSITNRFWKKRSIYIDSADTNQVTLSIYKNEDLLPDIHQLEQVEIKKFYTQNHLSSQALRNILSSATITDFGEEWIKWSFSPQYHGMFESKGRKYKIDIFLGNLIHLTLLDIKQDEEKKRLPDLWLTYK